MGTCTSVDYQFENLTQWSNHLHQIVGYVISSAWKRKQTVLGNIIFEYLDISKSSIKAYFALYSSRNANDDQYTICFHQEISGHLSLSHAIELGMNMHQIPLTTCTILIDSEKWFPLLSIPIFLIPLSSLNFVFRESSIYSNSGRLRPALIASKKGYKWPPWDIDTKCPLNQILFNRCDLSGFINIRLFDNVALENLAAINLYYPPNSNSLLYPIYRELISQNPNATFVTVWFNLYYYKYKYQHSRRCPLNLNDDSSNYLELPFELEADMPTSFEFPFEPEKNMMPVFDQRSMKMAYYYLD